MRDKADILGRRYRFLEAVPGLISWGLIGIAALIVGVNPLVFLVTSLIFTVYWMFTGVQIIMFSIRGKKKIIEESQQVDWRAKLDADFPDWHDYYYCTIIPFASESVNVIHQTVERLAESDFPKERKILCLSSEMAVPRGRQIAAVISSEFEDKFAHIFVTEHELKPGELKGKSSNQNHCGRFLYDRMAELGIPADHVLLSSNDADMLIDPHYETRLLHAYLSEGDHRDHRIYQPIPADLNNFWEADFFSRMIITTGILWRLNLSIKHDHRFTVYAFYSMSLRTLHDIGFWDVDLIPEDERTMFKAIQAFGKDFKVIPLYMIISGTPIRSTSFLDAFRQQYIQIRRWAWGASEFAHSMTVYPTLDKEHRQAMRKPILNQIRTSTEWALSAVLIFFASSLPSLFESDFQLESWSCTLLNILAFLISASALLVVAIIFISRHLTPAKPATYSTGARFFTYAQWVFTPVVGIVFGCVPAIDAQTRLIFNKRIAYVETKKE